MEYLKKYITMNVFAIFGYWILFRFIYYIVTNWYPLVAFGAIHNAGMSAIYSFPIFVAFTIEVIIVFVLSKSLKRKVGLNLKNKIYDFIYRLGSLFAFTPITIAISFFIWLFIIAVIGIFNELLGLEEQSILNFIILCIVHLINFYLLIRYVFFRKYFEQSKNFQ